MAGEIECADASELVSSVGRAVLYARDSTSSNTSEVGTCCYTDNFWLDRVRQALLAMQWQGVNTAKMGASAL